MWKHLQGWLTNGSTVRFVNHVCDQYCTWQRAKLKLRPLTKILSVRNANFSHISRQYIEIFPQCSEKYLEIAAGGIAQGTSVFQETNLWFSFPHCRMLHPAISLLLYLKTYKVYSYGRIILIRYLTTNFILLIHII